MRVLLGGVAAALAVTLVPQPASASHHATCAEGFEIICTVIDLLEQTCVETKYTPCY